MILNRIVQCPAPSIDADSTNADGIDSKLVLNIIILNVLIAVGKISDHILFSRPRSLTVK